MNSVRSRHRRTYFDSVSFGSFEELFYRTWTHVLRNKYDSWRSLFLVVDPVLVYLWKKSFAWIQLLGTLTESSALIMMFSIWNGWTSMSLKHSRSTPNVDSNDGQAVGRPTVTFTMLGCESCASESNVILIFSSMALKFLRSLKLTSFHTTWIKNQIREASHVVGN